VSCVAILLSPTQSFPLMAPNVRASQRPGVITEQKTHWSGRGKAKVLAITVLALAFLCPLPNISLKTPTWGPKWVFLEATAASR
jgi:hypothetical protein